MRGRGDLASGPTRRPAKPADRPIQNRSALWPPTRPLCRIRDAEHLAGCTLRMPRGRPRMTANHVEQHDEGRPGIRGGKIRRTSIVAFTLQSSRQ